MLSCADTKNLLSAYYDGELGVAASKQVEQHLGSCKDCQKEFDDMNYISKAFALLDYPKADEKFILSLRERLESESDYAGLKKFNFLSKKVRPYIAVAACMVLMIGVYAAIDNGYIFQDSSAPTPIAIDIQPDNTEKEETLKNRKTTEDEIKAAKSVKLLDVESKEKKKNGVDVQKHAKEKQVIIPSKTPKQDDKSDNSNTLSRAIEENREEHMSAYTEFDKPSEDDDIEKDNLESENIDVKDEELAIYEKKTVKTTFALNDMGQLDKVVDILKKYGQVKIFENHIDLKILRANYAACIETLNDIDGVDIKNTEDNDDIEYCSIRFEF